MNNEKPRSGTLSRTSTMHYIKLAFRCALFLFSIVFYIINSANTNDEIMDSLKSAPAPLIVIWLVFAIEMVFRFFPSKLESMGCQKQFSRNYMSAGRGKADLPEKRQQIRSTIIVAVSWVLFNAVIGLLYFTKVINQGILILICLGFSVCDMICILFFCPFQTLIMKNKCCVSCRIYNWDYAMMFTPLIFIRGIFTWSILALSLGLLIRWEVTYFRHPERFSETANKSLSCAKCQEKLCEHKKTLRRFWERQKKKDMRKSKLLTSEKQ